MQRSLAGRSRHKEIDIESALQESDSDVEELLDGEGTGLEDQDELQVEDEDVDDDEIGTLFFFL